MKKSVASVVKLTFGKGASLKDPARLFNSRLDGNVRRAIDMLSGIVEVKPAPTTAPAKRTQRQNIYDFKPRALRRAGDQAREEVGCAPTQSA